MKLLRGTWLPLLTLAIAAAASAPSDTLPGIPYPDPSRVYEAEERSWLGSRRKKSGEETRGKGTYALAPGDEYYKGGWSDPYSAIDGARDVYNGGESNPWEAQMAASESELSGVFSAERTRWMPTRSRFRSSNQPQMSEAELPIQEHQLRQQQQRRGRPGLRPSTQLENLGGGILVNQEDDEDEIEDDEEGDEEEEKVVYTPPPRKRPIQRRPQDLISENPSPKPSTPFADLKSILKASGPLSLSEILQQKNLSLEQLLKGSRNALSAITSVSDNGGKPQQRRRRPGTTTPITRPPLTRRRPSSSTTTTTPASRIVQHGAILTTREKDEDSEMLSSTVPSRSSPTLPSTGDPSRDILEIIWQDGGDGPTLAEVLSSRNMTVDDLIDQRKRASGRADITALFQGVKKVDKKEEDQREEEARNFAHFEVMEADWDQPQDEDDSDEKLPAEDDQQVTQSRNSYQVVSSMAVAPNPQVTEMWIALPSETSLLENSPDSDDHRPTVQLHVTETRVTNLPVPSSSEKPPYPENHRPIEDVQVKETRIINPQGTSMPENLLYSDDHRPIVRSRLTTPFPPVETVDGNGNVVEHFKRPSAPGLENLDYDYRDEESETKGGLPMGVTGAIIASSCLLGITLLIFLSIFAVFRYRQWKRRGGIGPYFCVAVMEAAGGCKKTKEPTIVKKERAKDSGWGDSIDSAQARLWRTLRRGRCRFYDGDRDQM